MSTTFSVLPRLPLCNGCGEAMVNPDLRIPLPERVPVWCGVKNCEFRHIRYWLPIPRVELEPVRDFATHIKGKYDVRRD